MTPAFINTNHHEAYIVDPERQDDRTSEASGLLRVAAESEFEVASGRLAEEAEKCPGVVKAGSAEAREFTKKGGTLDQRNLMRSSSGPDVFPVPEEERTAERSGLHITGRDSGVPVAAEAEPGDKKDGSGEDKFKGIAAVEQGKVTRGDVPKAVREEPSVETPGDEPLNKLSVKVLKKLAEERNVTVEGSGSKGGKTKPDYIRALEAAAGEGGGGGVAVQSEQPSRTQKSEAVGKPGGTLTTDDDPTTQAAGDKPKRRPARRSSRSRSSGGKRKSAKSRGSKKKSSAKRSRKGGKK